MNRKPKEYQLIITGPKSKQPNKILEFVNSQIKLKDWLDGEGNIGFLDNTTLSIAEVKHEFNLVAKQFLELEVGITYMSGPSGVYNHILETYLVKNGKVLKVANPHAGHPAPRRLKPKKLILNKPVTFNL